MTWAALTAVLAVMLSAAKHLCAPRARSFAALSMTGLDLAVAEELSSAFEPCLTTKMSAKNVVDMSSL